MNIRTPHLLLRIVSGTFRTIMLPLLVLTLMSSPLQAQQLDHQTQQDVLQFVASYRPTVVSADREMDLATLGKALSDKDIVFVAEQHDRYDHHLNQLVLLRLMHRQNPKLAIGVEWFQQPFQAQLDDYLAGKLDEAGLLKQSGYYARWRYDFRLLRPILEYARQHQLPVIALNAPTEITRTVSASGLAGLSPQERAQIPATIHPAQANYRQYLKTIFDQHMAGQGDFERFALVQRIWDETMAANIVRQRQADPQQRLLVFAGSGHLRTGAIPDDVARALPKIKFASVHSAARETISPGTFDYFILNEDISLPPTGKLGVWLADHNPPAPDKPHVTVRQLAEDSAAAEAGMQAGDRFINVNGRAVQSSADVLQVLASTRRGQEIEVGLVRPPAAEANPDQNNEQETTTLRKYIKLK